MIAKNLAVNDSAKFEEFLSEASIGDLLWKILDKYGRGVAEGLLLGGEHPTELHATDRGLVNDCSAFTHYQNGVID